MREPEGNGCAERFIRALEENLLWIRRFETVEDLRTALQQFKDTYNQTWIIECRGYETPAQVRAAKLGQIPMAAKRKAVSHFCGRLQRECRSVSNSDKLVAE